MEILQNEEEVWKASLLMIQQKLEKFQYLRGPKRSERTSADGHTYISEGGMSTDDLNSPGNVLC